MQVANETGESQEQTHGHKVRYSLRYLKFMWISNLLARNDGKSPCRACISCSKWLWHIRLFFFLTRTAMLIKFEFENVIGERCFGFQFVMMSQKWGGGGELLWRWCIYDNIVDSILLWKRLQCRTLCIGTIKKWKFIMKYTSLSVGGKIAYKHESPCTKHQSLTYGINFLQKCWKLCDQGTVFWFVDWVGWRG